MVSHSDWVTNKTLILFAFCFRKSLISLSIFSVLLPVKILIFIATPRRKRFKIALSYNIIKLIKSQAKRGLHDKIYELPRWRNGIRSGLKNLWSQGREGSIPSLGTFREGE